MKYPRTLILNIFHIGISFELLAWTSPNLHTLRDEFHCTSYSQLPLTYFICPFGVKVAVIPIPICLKNKACLTPNHWHPENGICHEVCPTLDPKNSKTPLFCIIHSYLPWIMLEILSQMCLEVLVRYGGMFFYHMWMSSALMMSLGLMCKPRKSLQILLETWLGDGMRIIGAWNPNNCINGNMDVLISLHC